MTLPCSVLGYIPQTKRMGFEQTMISASFGALHSKAVIPDNHIFLDDNGCLADIVLIEYLNQLAGASRCYNDSECENPRKGFFVGIQNAVFHESVHSGDNLDFYGELTDSFGAMDFVRAKVNCGEKLVAEFVTKLFYLDRDDEQIEVPDFSTISPPVEPLFAETPQYLLSPLQRFLLKYLRDLRIEDNTAIVTLSCPTDFAAFDGHFEGSPLLPGVTWGEIALLTAQLHEKRTLKLQSVKKMKLSGKLFPNQLFTCQITLTPTASTALLLKVTAKDENGNELANFQGICD